MKVSSKLNFILQQYENNRLSHAFLIETNNVDECFKELKDIICTINITDDFNKEYLKNLINLNNLPSLSVIEPINTTITKGQLEELEVKFSTKPIYSKFNTYVILNAEKMNESSSNSILKFIEEPADNIIGFLITTNKENILPTIRSRCEILNVYYDLNENINKELNNIVDIYIDSIFNSNDYFINRKLILNTYSDRESIEKILLIMFNKYYNNYHKSTTDNELFNKNKKIISIITNKLNMLKSNVNVELLLDSLVIELRNIK